MRICTVALSGFLLAAGVGVASAGDDHHDDNDDDVDVKMEDLPSAVRTTVAREAKDAVIEDIERGTKNGKVVYKVEIEKNNVDWKLYIDESGKVIKRKRD